MHLFGQIHSGYDRFDQADSRSAANRASTKADELERRLERAFLTMEAMWTLLRDKLEVSEEELARRIVDLDLADGQLDGKVRRPPMECPACKRTIPTRFPRCLYCGVEVAHDPFG